MAQKTSFERFDLRTAALDEGTVLLEASAGTGKTYTLTGILVRMLLENVVERIEQALVVTFTVAAANELKNRLRDALRQARAVCSGRPCGDPFFDGLAKFGEQGAGKLHRALDQFDQASVMTIHGFCKRLLDEAAFESHAPFDLEFAVDETPLWHAAAADALRLVREPDSLMLGAVLHHAALDPDGLVSLYRNWQRYPEVELQPAEPQLGVHVENLAAAVHRATVAWNDDLLESCTGFSWYSKKAPTTGDLREYLQHQTALMHQGAELLLPFFAAFARSTLLETLQKRSMPRLRDPFFTACDEVETAWQTAQDHLRCTLLVAMHERLAAHKQQRAVMTFDDLLQRTHAAVTDEARRQSLLRTIQQRYSVALIDEFQDTDERQYEILAACFGNRPMFLVGDPKQSIYAFRGADLRTYLAAAEHAVQKGTLTENFRSSRQLVAAVGHLFRHSHAFLEPDIRMHEVRAHAKETERLITGDPGAALRFRLLPATEGGRGRPNMWSPEDARQHIAADVTKEIRRLLGGDARIDGRPVLPRHIAVLTRRNVEAVMVQETLREHGVVSVIGRAGDVFETDELVELERLLLAIVRPNDLLRARAAMATRIWGYDAARLSQLDADDSALDTELLRLERWRQLWLRSGFVVMKEQLLNDLDADARLLARSDGERRLTNLQQLCEMLHQAEHEHRLSPEGLLHWLRHERAHKDEIDYQRRELRLESDEDAVQILTMHGSKGLQYEIVFCPYLWDGRLAQRRNTAIEPVAAPEVAEAPGHEPGRPARLPRRFVFMVEDDDPAWLRLEQDRLAEDVRLAYVALTRARRRCYVHWGPIGTSSFGGFWLSALGWLLYPDQVDRQQPDWPKSWAKAYRAHASQLEGELRAVVDQSLGSIGIDSIAGPSATIGGTAGPPAPTAPDGHGEPTTAARARRGRPMPRRQPLVVHSFSSLVAGSEPGSSAHEVRDPGATEQLSGSGIFGFARGPRAGLCLHALLENVDFGALDGDATRQQIQATLARHGLADASAHPGDLDPVVAVHQNLRDLAAARVHAGGPTVAAVCGGPRRTEWQFTIPVAAPDLQALASAFAEHGCAVARGYRERLQDLRPSHLAGFLTGFVDLVGEHDGRYWVIDWKSNHLGNDLADYGHEALLQAMNAHDYVLQYHLYVLALHRHLRTRIADYDYDRHVAGVCYPFLRGAIAGTDNGMFHARPPRGLIEAIEAWAAGGMR